MKFYRIFVLALLACISSAGLSGCTKVEEPDNRDLVYGYVQFKVYKNPTKALDFLHDAAKLKVSWSF